MDTITIEVNFTRDQAEALDSYFGHGRSHQAELASLLGNFAADLAEGKKESDERVRIALAAKRAKDEEFARQREVEKANKAKGPTA